jgi:GNAT superfamily N-acetyltransferase
MTDYFPSVDVAIDNSVERPHLAPVVRRAEQSDVPWVLGQLRQFAAAYGTRRSLFGSETHAEALVGTLIEDQFVAIAERDGQPVGLIAGVLQPHPFNPDILVASELWWWVTPPARGTRAGHELLDAFEGWALEHEADLINFTLEADSPVRDRTLERRGYRLFERQFLREVS